MKSNGRRAWRKWIKRYRRGHHAEWKRASAEWRACDGQAKFCALTGAQCKRKSGRQNGLYIQSKKSKRDIVKPFSLRSLVGMPMGARKRAVRKTDVVLGNFVNMELRRVGYPPEFHPQTEEDRRTYHNAWERGLARYEDWRKERRAKYCIGKLVRLCPGCCACQPCGGTDQRMCIVLCDGSGAVVVEKPAIARSASR